MIDRPRSIVPFTVGVALASSIVHEASAAPVGDDAVVEPAERDPAEPEAADVDLTPDEPAVAEEPEPVLEPAPAPEPEIVPAPSPPAEPAQRDYVRPKGIKARNEPIPKDMEWPHTFPVLGWRAHKEGRKVQLPFGVGINYIYFTQPIVIERLDLSTNDNPLETTDFIEFGDVTGTGHAANLRLDWFVLPFLNVYLLTSYVHIETPTKVVSPLEFTAVVPLEAVALGAGATLIGGMGPLFVLMDFNAQATYIPKNKDSTTALVTAPRAGYNHFFKRSRTGAQLSVWLGAMYTAITAGTEGSVTLSNVLPDLDQYQDELDAFRETLSPAQQRVFDRLMEQLNERPPRETTVNYRLDKRVEKPWNMLVGFNAQITPHWGIRGEVGFFGRTQVMIGGVYRFGAGLRAKRKPQREAKKAARAKTRTGGP